jgi:hypothetical protein
MSNVSLKLCDLMEFSKMCAPEYNMPELSDRVLVFDVMQDGWESARILNDVSPSEPNETLASTSTCDGSSEKQLLEKPEEPQSHKIEVKGDEPETGRNPGNQSENETQDLAYEQDSKTNEIDSPTTQDSTEVVAARAEKPNRNSENFNEPLRQHKIYVHSFWLSVQSPYFRSLFYSSGMKENQDTEVHVKVSESEENAHLILLEAMYHDDVVNDRTVDELLAVLELANKYDLKFVFKKCKYVLQENATNFEISTQIMDVIKVKHNMDDVQDLAATLQSVLVQELSPLDENWQSEKFSSLSEPSLKYLLSSDDLIVASENTVFHALMYWMEQNDIDPASLEETNDLLAVVRFKLVTIDYLYNVINNHPIASKMPKFNELYLGGMTYHAIPAEQKELLERQPVVRKKPEGLIIQHVAVYKEQDFETAKETRTYKSSNEFWACGYKMSVGLNWSHSVYGDYMYPQLNVHNINKESLVRLNFAFILTKTDIRWQETQFGANCSITNCCYHIPHKKCNMYMAIRQ